jgi:hypothetical protein
MNRAAVAMRWAVHGVLAVGMTVVTGCGDDGASETRGPGTISIPLQTTVGANTYRLAATFDIVGAQGTATLVSTGTEPVVSTTLPAGSYHASVESFTLYKDPGTGTFVAVPATIVSNDQAFSIFAHSTTTISFVFETQAGVVSVGSGNVNITFTVDEGAEPCTVFGAECAAGSWCPPPALTGKPAACLPAGTLPVGAHCNTPLDCAPPSTCHDFGDGPVCTPVCTPSAFGSACPTGGTCVEADPTFGLCTPEHACTPITVDLQARTVQSARFQLDFSNVVANNPEDLDVLRWAGGANLAQSFAIDACTYGVVEHFGNSWGPPDPGFGGTVLVGSGSTGSWEQDGSSIVIHSVSSGCDHTTSIPVETRYTFREGKGADTIEVERRFDLASAPLDRSFRPFIPRMTNAFDRVLHPNVTASALVNEGVFDCPYGCTRTDWDGSWFAYYASSGPLAGQGVIVRREQSVIPANLWVDYDAGITDTNTTSVLLLPPPGGFPAVVEEREILCFFDAESWTPAEQAALTLPEGCTLGLACDGSGTGDVLPCQPNPCQHGGTCSVDGEGGYTCHCPPSVTGQDCEIAFTDVQLGNFFTCGLRTDGHILCWGDGGGQGVPNETFKALAVGGFASCGLRSDGTPTCWGYTQQGIGNTPSGSFDGLVAYSDYACALHDHVPTCWGDRTQADPPPDTVLSAMDIGHSHSCGIRLDGTVACSGSNDFGQSTPPPGTFHALSLSPYSSCGIRQTDATLECWGSSFTGLPTGPLQAIDIDLGSGCAIAADGHLTCWGTNTLPPDGTFKKVGYHQLTGCAIGTNDQLVCWGNNVSGNAIPPY